MTPRERQQARYIDVLCKLLVDLSDDVRDEAMRRRVANALPPSMCPDWLNMYRDPPMVQS